jgi:hypothetical protein
MKIKIIYVYAFILLLYLIVYDIRQTIEYKNTYINKQSTSEINLYLSKLSSAESSNRWKCVGGYNHKYIGLYQFGKSALKDIGYDYITINEFKHNPNIFPKKEQHLACIKLMKLNKKRLGKYYNEYNNKYINGIKITHAGLLASCHLVGTANVIKFINSNGKVIPTDGFGTSIKTYMKLMENVNI